MQNTIKFLIVFVLVFILGVFFISLNKSSIYDTEFLIGNKINNFKLENFQDENFIISEDLKKNNFTLINFWASWCAPCRNEHHILMKLSKEKKLRILGVNFKDNRKNALKFLNDLGNPYHYIAKDKSGKHSVTFGVYGIPESILINKKLVIQKKFIGPLTNEDLEEIKGITN